MFCIDTVLGSPVFLSCVPDPAPRARPPATVSEYSNSRQSSRLQLSGFQSFRSCVNLVLPNTEHRTQILHRVVTPAVTSIATVNSDAGSVSGVYAAVCSVQCAGGCSSVCGVYVCKTSSGLIVVNIRDLQSVD